MAESAAATERAYARARRDILKALHDGLEPKWLILGMQEWLDFRQDALPSDLLGSGEQPVEYMGVKMATVYVPSYYELVSVLIG